MKIRGAGDILGVRQAGVPRFRLGDVVKHGDIMTAARKMAQEASKGDEVERKRLAAAATKKWMRALFGRCTGESSKTVKWLNGVLLRHFYTQLSILQFCRLPRSTPRTALVCEERVLGLKFRRVAKFDYLAGPIGNEGIARIHEDDTEHFFERGKSFCWPCRTHPRPCSEDSACWRATTRIWLTLFLSRMASLTGSFIPGLPGQAAGPYSLCCCTRGIPGGGRSCGHPVHSPIP